MLPKIREVSQEDIAENYKKINADIQKLIAREMEKMTPVIENKEQPAKSLTEEKAKADSTSKPKIANALKKSKKHQKKRL